MTDKEKKIRNLLANHKSVSLLELGLMSELPDVEVHEIVLQLSNKGLVRISHPGDPLDEIVTVREGLLRTAAAG